MFFVSVSLPPPPSSSPPFVLHVHSPGRRYTPKASNGPIPFVVYNGEGFYSGVEYGDLTAHGAKV